MAIKQTRNFQSSIKESADLPARSALYYHSVIELYNTIGATDIQDRKRDVDTSISISKYRRTLLLLFAGPNVIRAINLHLFHTPNSLRLSNWICWKQSAKSATLSDYFKQVARRLNNLRAFISGVAKLARAENRCSRRMVKRYWHIYHKINIFD